MWWLLHACRWFSFCYITPKGYTSLLNQELCERFRSHLSLWSLAATCRLEANKPFHPRIMIPNTIQLKHNKTLSLNHYTKRKMRNSAASAPNLKEVAPPKWESQNHQQAQSSSFTYTTTRLIIAVVPLFNLQPRPKWGSLLPSSPLPPLSSPLRPASATSLRRLTIAPPKTAAVTLAAHPTATSAQLIKSETSSVLFTYVANLTDLSQTANAQQDVEALSLTPRHEAQGRAPPLTQISMLYPQRIRANCQSTRRKHIRENPIRLNLEFESFYECFPLFLNIVLIHMEVCLDAIKIYSRE